MDGSSTRVVARSGLAAAVVALLLVQVARLDLPLDDYEAYWSASRLLLAGHDPYDLDALLALQRELGHVEEKPQVLWNPPFALPLVLPCGVLPYRASRAAWLLASLLVVVASVEALWRVYARDAGERARRLGPILATAAFLPVAVALREGQLGPFIALGIAAFVSLVDRPGPRAAWAAGAMLPLVAIKPHSVHLLWPALALWLVRERRWRVLAGGLVATGLLLAVVLAFDPAVLVHYRTALAVKAARFVQDFPTATLASELRLAIGWEHTWPLLVPPALAWGWLAGRTWRRRRLAWSWSSELPLLVLVSLVSAPYGWSHHLVLALPAVLHGAALVLRHRDRPRARLVVAGHAALAAAVLGVALLSEDREPSLWWLSSAYLALYGLARTLDAPAPAGLPAAPPPT